jgi:hypothetical protein
MYVYTEKKVLLYTIKNIYGRINSMTSDTLQRGRQAIAQFKQVKEITKNA